MQELFDQIDELKIILDKFRPIPDDRMNRIMQKLRLEWNFNSNSMEGNTLTMTETRKLLYYGLTAKGKPIKDHIEMQGHDAALKKLEGLVHKEFKLTETLIRDFHKMILVNSPASNEKNVEVNPGYWKENWNFLYTPTGEQIYFADPKDVPDLMSELINWTNNQLYQEKLNRHNKKKYDAHPLLVACIFHKRFIDIHPFGDGNGRMARILSNLILMQVGFMPAIVPLNSKDDYYNALNNSSAEDMSPLVEYIGRNLIKSMELAIEGAKGNPVEEPEDWEKELEVLTVQFKNTEEYKKMHYWSLENQARIVESVFVPFIKILDVKLNRIKEKLFERGDWNILQDILYHEPSRYANSLELINELQQHSSQEEKNSFTFYYELNEHRYVQSYRSTIVLIDMEIEKEHYSFKVEVEDETSKHELTRSLKQIFDLASKKEKKVYGKTFIHEQLYSSIPKSEEIELWANETMNILMAYLKERYEHKK